MSIKPRCACGVVHSTEPSTVGGSCDGWLDLVDTCPNCVHFGTISSTPASVQVSKLKPLGWQRALFEDGADRALRLARAKVDALVGMNIQFAVDAIRLE